MSGPEPKPNHDIVVQRDVHGRSHSRDRHGRLLLEAMASFLKRFSQQIQKGTVLIHGA